MISPECVTCGNLIFEPGAWVRDIPRDTPIDIAGLCQMDTSALCSHDCAVRFFRRDLVPTNPRIGPKVAQ